MSFLDEFDRRAQDEKKPLPENLPQEERELLEFADLIRSRRAPLENERERVLAKLRSGEAKPAATIPLQQPARSTGWSIVAAAAAVVMVIALTFAVPGKPVAPVASHGDGTETKPGAGSAEKPLPVVQEVALGPIKRAPSGPPLDSKAIQDEFSGVAFPELKPAEGAVEAPGEKTNARILRATGLALRQGAGEKRWQVCARGQAITPGTILRVSKRMSSVLKVLAPDGSFVSMAPGSSLRYDGARAWQLMDGGASFEVASREDLEKFTVTTPHGKTRALGTQFSLEVVNGDAGSTVCWVDEGKVSIGDENKVCAAGEGRRFDKKGIHDGSRPKDMLAALNAALSGDHGIGQLVAQADKAGEQLPLEINSHEVTVTVMDQVARTFVDMVFVNNSDRRLEGTFYYPLPPDASISEFAMYVDDKRIVGEVLEQQRARQIFEYIVRQQRDPALLEYAGGNIFKMRVFPIEPRSEKRVQLGYTQILTRSGGKVSYTYPLLSEMLIKNPLHSLKLNFRVLSSSGLENLSSPTHVCASGVSEDKRRGAMAFSAKKYSPSRDFTVTYDVPNAPECVAFANQRPDDENAYFMLQLCPGARSIQSDLQQRLLVIVDGSASSVPQDYAIATEFAASAAEISKNWEFGLVRGGQRPERFTSTLQWSDATTPDKVREFLGSRQPLGATDLLATFREAAKLLDGDTALRIVYVGDGVDTVNEMSSPALLRELALLFRGKNVTLSTVAVGSSYERPVMQGLAGQLGGTFVRVEGADGVHSAVGQVFDGFYRAALRNVSVSFDGVTTHSVYPEQLGTLTAGDTAVVLGRVVKGGKGRVTVRADAGGEAFEKTYDIDLSANETGNRFLPRLWARAHMEALQANMGLGDDKQDAGIRAAVIETSINFQIMSPFTAFLVLESEEDYARFGIKRKLKQWDWTGDAEGVGGKAAGKAGHVFQANEQAAQAAAPAPQSEGFMDGLEDWGDGPDNKPASKTQRQAQEKNRLDDADGEKQELADTKADELMELDAGSDKDGSFKELKKLREMPMEETGDMLMSAESLKRAELSDHFETIDDGNGFGQRDGRARRNYAYNSRYKRGGGYQHHQSLVLQPGKVVDLEVDQPLRSLTYYQRLDASGKGTFSTRLNLSLALEAQGRFADALKVLLVVIEKHPNLLELRLQEASLRFRTGDEAGAKAALEKAIELAPEKERPALRERINNLHSSLGRYIDAASGYSTLAREATEAPRAAQMAQSAGYSFQNAGQLDKAVELWDEILKRFPDDDGVKTTAGQWFVNSGRNYDRGIALLTQVGKMEPHVRQQLLYAYCNSGKREEALAEARKMLDTAKDPSAVYSVFTAIANLMRDFTKTESMRLLQDGSGIQAAGALQYLYSYGMIWNKTDAPKVLAAISRKDLAPAAQAYIGYVLSNYHQQKLVDKATLLKTLEPFFTPPATKEAAAGTLAMAQTLMNQNLHAEALQMLAVLAQFKELEPYQRVQAAIAEYTCLQRSGKTAEAKEKLTAAFDVKLDEHNLYQVAYNSLWAHLNENKFDAALDIVDKFAAQYPDSDYIAQLHQNILPRIRQQMKEPDAEKLVDRLIKSYPQNVSFTSLRVQLLTSKGKWREAAGIVRELLKKLEQAPLQTEPAPAEKQPAEKEDPKQSELQRREKLKAAQQRRESQRLWLINMLARLSSQDAELRAAFIKEADENIPNENGGEREWTEAALICLNAAGDAEACAKRLEKLAAAEPTDPVWQYRYGNSLVAAKQLAQARAVFAKMSDADPADYSLAMRLYELCTQLKDTTAADSYFARAFEAIAKDANRLQQFAGNWQAQKPEWSAKAWLRYAEVIQDSQKGYGYYMAGSVYQQAGRPADALPHFLSTLCVPDSGYAANSIEVIIQLCQQEAQLRALEPMLEQKLKGAPPANAPLLLLVRYRLEKLKEKHDAASAVLQQAIAMKDTPYNTASMLINFLINEKKYDAAEKYAREGGKVSKEERRQLLRNMIHAGMDQREVSRKIRIVRELLETPDQNVDYDRQQLVNLLVSAGNLTEAEKEVRAMKNSRDNWTVQNAWNNVINGYQNKQNYAEALRLAKELVASESDDDNSGRRNNAMNMLMNVAAQAIRHNRLDAQTRELCVQEIVRSASGYFSEKNSSPPWYQLGHDDLAKFGIRPAIDKLAAEAAASNQPRRISLAAQYYQQYQRYDDAVRLYKLALTLPDADERNIAQQLYGAYMNLGNRIPWGDAVDLLEKLYQSKAYDENSYRMERVRCLYALKRRDDARVEVKKLMESRNYWRNGHWGMQNLANYCQSAEDWTMAVEVWELALRLFRKNSRSVDMHSAAQLYVSCANAYSRAGDQEKSIDCFLRGMSLVPRNHESYRYLMDEALKQIIKDGSIDRIVAEYEKKVKAGAGDKPHLRIAFAEAYKRSNNEKKALENFRAAADMLPKDMTLRKQVIDGYKKLGDNETALASYRDWAKLDPQNIDIYSGMGDLYHALGQRDNALLAWATMAEVRPREAEGYRAYAQKLTGINMHAQAATALRQAVKYRPTVFDISSELAQVYRTLGQNDQVAPLWTEGEKACRKAMEDFADDPLPWLSLGRFLDAAGKKSEARKVYSDILNRQWPRFQNETYQEARERMAKL